MNQGQNFKTQFNEALTARGIAIAKLSELSGVPERYLEAMRAGNLSAMPPAPYVRGYLNKISNVLLADAEALWAAYKTEQPAAIMSGLGDRLPQNRYSLKKLNKGAVAGIAAACLLLGYGLLRFNTIVGKPTLLIENPQTATVVVNFEEITLRGKISAGDTLTINGEINMTGEGGIFEKDLHLSPGINAVEFRAKRFLGQEISDIRKIIYEPAAIENASSTAASKTQ